MPGDIQPPTPDFSTLQQAAFVLEEIHDKQWIHIEVWAYQKQGVSDSDQAKRQVMLHKLREDFNLLKQALAATKGEYTWQKLQTDPKFKRLVNELQKLLNIDSLKSYLDEKMAEQGQLENEAGEDSEDLFLPNEYIDPDEFSFEQIERANSIIGKKLFFSGADMSQSGAELDEEMLKNLDTIYKFLSDQKTTATTERESRRGAMAGLDLAWIKVNEPVVWHALCAMVKKDPKILRMILGEPTVFTQSGLATDEEHEQKRQEEITKALPNTFNLAILRTAFKSESDSEFERLRSKELLKELYGDNIPEELNSGDMLALRAEISTALEHIKDERIRKIVREGYDIILFTRFNFNKLKRVAEFEHWPEFFENIDKMQYNSESVSDSINDIADKALQTITADLAELRKTPSHAQAAIKGIGQSLGFNMDGGKRKIRINGMMRFCHQRLRAGFSKATDDTNITMISLIPNGTTFLNTYIENFHAGTSADVINLDTDKQFGDLTNFDLHRIDFTDKDISGLDFSDSLFGLGDDNPHVSFIRCNPENTKFKDAKGLPRWIKLGLDENGIFTSEQLQKTLEKLSRERKEKEDSGDYSDYPAIEDMELMEDGVYAESSLIAAGRDGLDLRGANLINIDLYKINLFRANLEGAIFKGTKYVLPEWVEAGLDESHIFHQEQLVKKIKDGKIKRLKDVNLRGVDLSGANLSGYDFRNACLAEANLEGCDLTLANLEGTNLYRANLKKPKLNISTNMKQCCVEGATFSETSSSAHSQYWIQAGLDPNKIFKKTVLANNFKQQTQKLQNGHEITNGERRVADFAGADFTQIDFKNTRFDVLSQQENTSYYNHPDPLMWNENVHHYNLNYTDFRGSDFENANIKSISLYGSDFRGCNWKNIQYDAEQIYNGKQIFVNLENTKNIPSGINAILSEKNK
ncbi:MAG: hypothetical protein A3J93_04005 [Candidatus Magasanikbacteria bacterium RIFOXYC2_FULL_42_28]|uniref:Uncharacterized protein n=1 Tax=Candidatus Magasanikbacteria bacterium RIFOXYC2_FULL_42_28 TaxID=1798704 RepID=A0A1F6NVJ3_9BACT|nr:MAG: hypothetical protein A3J93_04005 [Candidatus Magasanikbacteria bacterium RIFOXYC2_FULL_42_28]